MKKIALYSSLKINIDNWRDYLSSYDLKIIKNQKELENLQNQLLIISTNVNLEKEEETIETLLKNNNKILVLDSAPKLINAQNWLLLGVQGYGNSMMNKIYIKSAIQTINSGLIWLIPDITLEILKNLETTSKETNKKSQEILNTLSKAELQVALLLKKGYSNTTISQNLNCSINTVKTHIKNIYLKLDVNDRFSFINLLNR